MIIKKGAMFGLDARIALAIFGALSVISGTALYSVIQESKAVALLSEMTEVGKAWEAYYLDTGQSLPQLHASNTNPNFYRLKTTDLAINSTGVSGWNGPYVSYSPDSNYLAHPSFRFITIDTLTSEVWGGVNLDDPLSKGACTSGKNCYVYVMINGVDNDSMAKVIDARVDGSDGSETGRFRWWDNSSSSYKIRYYFQVGIIENPND